MKNVDCIFCGSYAQEFEDGFFHRFNECPVCGRYLYQRKLYGDMINKYKNEYAFFLYHNGNKEVLEDDRFFFYIGDDNNYEAIKEEYPWNHRIVETELKAIKNISFSEMITKIMIRFAEKAKYPGNYIDLSGEELKSALFIRRYDDKGEDLDDHKIRAQMGEITDYLKDNRYIEAVGTDDGCRIMIKPEG